VIFSKSHNFDQRNQGRIVLWRNWNKKKWRDQQEFAINRSYFWPNELLMYLFSFLWNEILVLIFCISFICKGWIRWNALHQDAYTVFLYIDQHPGNNCVLFIELFTNRHVSAIKKITTVFLFQLLQFDYEVWEIIIYFTTCFSLILISYKEYR
jgi:hypothetical protein